MTFWIGDNQKVDSQLISDLIKEHVSYHDLAITSYNYYTGKDLPISTRTFTDTTKLNNKVQNDFIGEIVDQITGFLFGKPVNYMLSQGSDKDKKYLSDFLTSNSMDDVDLETGKYSAICGSGSRLLYIDPKGKERIMYIPSWETIFVYNAALTEVELAIRYYLMEDNITGIIGTSQYITHVEVYDKVNVSYYMASGGEYVPDTTRSKFQQPHGFDLIPLLEFPNNNERQSDFYKVTTLIDSYDRVVSDEQNEIEEFRNAYLVFEGCEASAEFMTAARQTGAISVPVGAKASFLTKDINPEFLKDHKDTLRDNIYRFSKTVDITNENFTGSGASGETRKWLMVALELKAAIKEMKFRKATNEMFKVLETLWAKKGVAIVANDIVIQVDRLYPAELGLESTILSSLGARVSNKTALSLMSFVDDVDSELEQIKKEDAEKPKETPDATGNIQASEMDRGTQN